ncbi:MAG TPA: MBL fold metallo-hydrolase [bacterium]|nr:MBL fold metallo-hydrolase [bacterium]
MKIRFWGVRGSIPTPGKNTLIVGGNTSCVEILSESGSSLIFDSGTGIREFGFDYLKRENFQKQLHVFISHVHWDHIQGFPFFVPAYLPAMEINIHGQEKVKTALKAQMSSPFFPVGFGELKAKLNFIEITEEPLKAGGCVITPFLMKHPQDDIGFSIEENGKKVVYSGDTEHSLGGDHASFIAFMKNADMLIFDAQYTPEEYKSRIGWGHSSFEVAVEVAKEAGVKKLVLFHHEPTHDDAFIERIEAQTREMFENTVAAREGMIIEV